MRSRTLLALVAVLIWASPAFAQTFAPPTFITPDGEKKLGQYIWVWHTQRLVKDRQVTVQALCPAGYVVLGGGYIGKGGFAEYGERPSQTFDAWDVLVTVDYSPAIVTAYASCAPD